MTLNSSQISRARNKITSRLATDSSNSFISDKVHILDRQTAVLFSKFFALKTIRDCSIQWLHYCCADPPCGQELWFIGSLISNNRIMCFFSTRCQGSGYRQGYSIQRRYEIPMQLSLFIRNTRFLLNWDSLCSHDCCLGMSLSRTTILLIETIKTFLG